MPLPNIPSPLSWLSMPSSVRVTCHRCGYEWTYMGCKVERVQPEVHSRKPVRIWCPRCRAAIRLDKIISTQKHEEN